MYYCQESEENLINAWYFSVVLQITDAYRKDCDVVLVFRIPEFSKEFSRTHPVQTGRNKKKPMPSLWALVRTSSIKSFLRNFFQNC